ncbi:hypothetical protein DI53_3314 [Sphingobacterium deserti]|uniref:Uncharacterized protein n=1 Tax=Sphingobacterium deserti TaxID=1229276 RepID=A0A0B8SZ45_9SPHI|nr:hypothetical protein DI53_3314 [Sphingobacterium deserti]
MVRVLSDNPFFVNLLGKNLQIIVRAGIFIRNSSQNCEHHTFLIFDVIFF